MYRHAVPCKMFCSLIQQSSVSFALAKRLIKKGQCQNVEKDIGRNSVDFVYFISKQRKQHSSSWSSWMNFNEHQWTWSFPRNELLPWEATRIIFSCFEVFWTFWKEIIIYIWVFIILVCFRPVGLHERFCFHWRMKVKLFCRYDHWNFLLLFCLFASCQFAGREPELNCCRNFVLVLKMNLNFLNWTKIWFVCKTSFTTLYSLHIYFLPS